MTVEDRFAAGRESNVSAVPLIDGAQRRQPAAGCPQGKEELLHALARVGVEFAGHFLDGSRRVAERLIAPFRTSSRHFNTHVTMRRSRIDVYIVSNFNGFKASPGASLRDKAHSGEWGAVDAGSDGCP